MPRLFVFQQNHEGIPIGAGAMSLDETTITVAEATALKEGLLLARRKGVQRLLVEGDSLLCHSAWA